MSYFITVCLFFRMFPNIIRNIYLKCSAKIIKVLNYIPIQYNFLKFDRIIQLNPYWNPMLYPSLLKSYAIFTYRLVYLYSDKIWKSYFIVNIMQLVTRKYLRNLFFKFCKFKWPNVDTFIIFKRMVLTSMFSRYFI